MIMKIISIFDKIKGTPKQTYTKNTQSSTPTPLRTHYVHSQFATVNGAGQFETNVLLLIIAQQQFADEACSKDLMKQ